MALSGHGLRMTVGLLVLGGTVGLLILRKKLSMCLTLFIFQRPFLLSVYRGWSGCSFEHTARAVDRNIFTTANQIGLDHDMSLPLL